MCANRALYTSKANPLSAPNSREIPKARIKAQHQIGIIGWRIVLSAEASESAVEQVYAEWCNRCDQHIHTQIEFASVQQVRLHKEKGIK